MVIWNAEQLINMADGMGLWRLEQLPSVGCTRSYGASSGAFNRIHSADRAM